MKHEFNNVSEMVPQLFHAVEAADLPTVQKLIGKGVDLNAKDGSGETALMLAAGRELPEITRLLLENGAAVNAMNNLGHTPLDFAMDAPVASSWLTKYGALAGVDLRRTTDVGFKKALEMGKIPKP